MDTCVWGSHAHGTDEIMLHYVLHPIPSLLRVVKRPPERDSLAASTSLGGCSVTSLNAAQVLNLSCFRICSRKAHCR